MAQREQLGGIILLGRHKSETLNPKSETNPKQQIQMLKTVLPGEFRTLEH